MAFDLLLSPPASSPAHKLFPSASIKRDIQCRKQLELSESAIGASASDSKTCKRKKRRTRKKNVEFWSLKTLASQEFDLNRLTERQQMAMLKKKEALCMHTSTNAPDSNEERRILQSISPFVLDSMDFEAERQFPVKKTTVRRPIAKENVPHQPEELIDISELANTESTPDRQPVHIEESQPVICVEVIPEPQVFTERFMHLLKALKSSIDASALATMMAPSLHRIHRAIAYFGQEQCPEVKEEKEHLVYRLIDDAVVEHSILVRS